jgi:hypothetical protein
MHRTLKTIKVDWLGGAMLEMYPECFDAGVVIASFAQTGPSTREGP